MMNREEIQNQINELELAIAECEFGATDYDFLTAEVEYLYLKRDRMVDKQ
jgi:redox-regulated HSP33 family molecular chaperone